MRLTDGQRLDWLRLIRSDGIGPRTFRGLVARFGGAGAALDHLPELARKGGRRIGLCSIREAERELEAARRLGARFVALGEAEYPTPLQAIDTAPPLLAVTGDPGVFARPAVAIVGSRNASAAGLAFTERLAHRLGAEGYVIASGLARGIDARAHKASMATGTVAVLAGGHACIYPPDHAGLLAGILDAGGAAVSEMPLGWEPRARDFPRRNRIVSGLSHGVVVVEAARRSGSLITARYALEQGREIFAVPGSPLDPRAEGTNELIRDGATLCASADHVLAALAPLVTAGVPVAPAGLRLDEPGLAWDEWPGEDLAEEAQGPPDTPASVVLGLLGPAPATIDDVARLAGLPVRVVNGVLLELELAGRIERNGTGAVSLVDPQGSRGF